MMIPAMLRMVVVLPGAVGAHQAQHLPGSTLKESPWTAGKSPYSFCKPSTSITGVLGAGR